MRRSQTRCCESSSLKTPVYAMWAGGYNLPYHTCHKSFSLQKIPLCNQFNMASQMTQPILQAFWPNEPSDFLMIDLTKQDPPVFCRLGGVLAGGGKL